MNNDECFVRALNKQTGKNKAYPINSLKEPMKLNQILNSLGKEDVFLSLNPFRTMAKSTRDNLFCINAIAVDIDYKQIKRLKELLDRKFLKDIELLELEDNDYVIDCKFIKPYNAHYNEYEVFVREDDEIKIYKVYLKHR